MVVGSQESLSSESNGLKERIAKAINSQSQATVTVLSSLLAIDDEFGYIPEEAIDEVAGHTRSTVNDVWGVASFYTNFRLTPPGSHRVELCWGPSCHVLGATQVVKAILDDLGLHGEGDTPDGWASVRFNTCLGACAQGPVISMDHQLIGRLTPSRARELVLLLRSERRGEPES